MATAPSPFQFKVTPPAARQPRVQAASANLKTAFAATLNAGGTQSSAGNYPRRAGSTTTNPR